MNMFRFIPIRFTFFLVLGILIGKHLNISISSALIITGCSLATLTYFFRRTSSPSSSYFSIATTFTVVSVGLLSYAIWLPQNWKDHYSNRIKVSDNTLRLKITEVLKSNSYSNRYVAHVDKTNGYQTSGKIIFNLPSDSDRPLLQVDHELLIHGNLLEIKAPLNPYQFDYSNYLKNLGISHQLNASKDSYQQSKSCSTTIYGFAAITRNKFIQKLKESNFGKEELAIIQALILGQRNSISTATFENYKNAGAVHILAVSGLHIGILLFILQFLLSPLNRLPKGKTLQLVFSVILLWCFALLAGFSASVVRAVTMFSFVAYALYLNRPSNTFNILALSMFFILLLFDPMLLFHVGFQMSYAAVFSIVWVFPILQRFWYPKNIIVRKIWQLLSVSLAAQLGVLPISLFYFHQFPGLFFISNLLIVPFLGILLGMGIVVLVLALFNLLPDFLVAFYNEMIGLMNSIIEWVAQQEAFVFKNISFDAVQMVLAYATIIALLRTVTKPSFKRTVMLLILIIAFQSWFLYVENDRLSNEQLLLIHQTKNSVLFHKYRNHLDVYHAEPDVSRKNTTDFIIGERLEEVRYQPLRNSYSIRNSHLIFVDSTGIYPSIERPEYLILTQSPRLNLERLIDSIKPKIIIADGSNYKSAIERWRKTCAKRKLPFHYTGEKGAFYFK